MMLPRLWQKIKKSSSFSHTPEILLGVVIVFAVVTNIIWIAKDASPPLWDLAGHSYRAATYAQFLEQGSLRQIMSFDTIYPPASYIVTAVIFVLFGYHANIPQYSLLPWLVLLMVSTYVLGKNLFGKKWVGVLASLLLLFYPQVLHFSRIYDLDFQQTAAVTFALAALVLTKNFTHRGWSVVLGVALGLAFLTKWTTVFFLLGPVLFIALEKWQKVWSKQKLANMILAVGTAIVLSGPWYATHGQRILDSTQGTRNNIFSVPYENLWSVGNITYYADRTVDGISWPLAAFALAALFMALRRRSKADAFLAIWFFVPYFIMTFVLFSKESRYFLPAFPAVALLTSSFFRELTTRARVIGVSLLMIVGLFFWVETSWTALLIPHEFHKDIKLYQNYGYFAKRENAFPWGYPSPTQYQTNVPKIADAIRDDIRERANKKDTYTIIIVPNSVYLSGQQIQYYGRLNGLENVDNAYVLDYSLSGRVRTEEWSEAIIKADYVVTKTGDQGPPVWAGYLGDIVYEESLPESPIFSQFERMGTWQLQGVELQPQEARLYRHR